MSYTSQQFLVADSSTTANFDAWGSAVSAVLTACGWTKTSDTGQVNWGSTPAFPAAGASVYEIWQPGDALQTGSTKFYLRIDYANITNVGMGFIFQLGTGTNGSGTLTGFVTNKISSGGVPFTGAGNQGATTYECDFSGDTNRFGMLMWRNATNQRVPCVYAIERTKDTSGADNSDGVTLYCFSSGFYGTAGVVTGSGTNNNDSGPFQQTIAFGVGTANLLAGGAGLNNGFAWLDALNNASDVFNNSIPVTPVFPDYGKFGNPSTCLAGARTQDIAEGAIFTTSLYGATRTYLASNNFRNGVGAGSPGRMRLCLRYD